MSAEEASTTWVRFLETQAPNSPKKIPELIQTTYTGQGRRYQYIACPPITTHCDRDGGFRIFSTEEKIYPKTSPECDFITYRCRNCQTTTKIISVMIEWNDDANIEVMKLGEYPPFSVPVAPRIQKLFSAADLELYRKGTVALRQGLGIGSASYFRRIVEGQWSRLVTEIRQAAERLGVVDLAVYDAALQETQFSRAVATLKDALPDKLLILDGQNPLTLLYRPLSQQLHGLTDEQCLQQAADIQLVLTALLENISDVLKDQEELQDAARRLAQN